MTISATSQGLKPGVCTSSNRPANPFDGMVIYETDTDKAMVWNGSSWVHLSTGTANPATSIVSGLQLISTNTFSSNVLQVNNCFSSTFTNYRIVMNLRGSTANAVTIWMRLSKNGTTSNAGYYSLSNYLTASGGPTRDYGANLTQGWWSATVADLATDGSTMEIFEPFVSTAKTTGTAIMTSYGSGQAWHVTTSLYHSTADSYDGFYLYPNAGNCTGTVRVYGYRD